MNKLLDKEISTVHTELSKLKLSSLNKEDMAYKRYHLENKLQDLKDLKSNLH